MLAPCCVVLTLLTACGSPAEPSRSPIALKPYAPPRATPERPLTREQIYDKNIEALREELRDRIGETNEIIKHREHSR